MPSRRPEAAPHARDGTSLVPWVCIATLVCVFCANRLLVAWGDSHWLRDHLILEGRFFKARWWTPLTYSLLHLDLAHLAVNGAGLALFGRALGESWSGSRLAVLTLLSALGGAALWLAFHHGQRGAVTGASAVLAGYVAAYVLDRPCEKIPLPGLRIGFPRWLLLAAVLLWELHGFRAHELNRRLAADALSHSAHLGGLAAGALALALFRLVAGTVRSRPDLQE